MFKPQVEQLERRDTPTTAFVSGNVLYVQGTAGDDTILVTQNGDGSLSVSDVAGTFNANSIAILGYAGNDRLEVDVAITKVSRLYGLDGNDTLLGGSGGDFLYGGNGDDEMYGRDGNDSMNGGFGTDLFNGGAGFDTAIDDKDDARTLIDVENVQLIDYP